MLIGRVGLKRLALAAGAVWLTSVVLFLYTLDTNGRTDGVGEETWYDHPRRIEQKTIDDGPNDELPRDELAVEQEEKQPPVAVQRTTAELADLEGKSLLGEMMKSVSFRAGGPGDMGRAVKVEKTLEKEMNTKFKLNQFNVMASDKISINRTLPDYRSYKCRSKQYNEELPSTSVIIVFHNEAWSTLLRSLHSVINRSPRKNLQEIILIDDMSERDYLKSPLSFYIRTLPVPCTLVHLERRSGLIKARLRGAELAVGEVLLFLDAHIEVTPGWLPPLLERIRLDKKRVVAPIIDVISDDTFEYVTASDTTWGGFNWHLNFRWFPVAKRELDRRHSDRSAVIRTPTIAGGLFAIDKKYFYDIGAYDEGMQVWGGENLEISFRVWTCGGSLEITPCSRVGHVFRKQTPYTFPGGTATVIHHNAARTAEVWMDEYKVFFYKITPAARRVEVGDVSARKELRRRLQCKSFRWYLTNIYKEAPIPLDFYSIGYVKALRNNMCLDTMGRKSGAGAGVSGCHSMGGNQAWSYTANEELRADELCLSGSTRAPAVRLDKCAANGETRAEHRWTYDVKADGTQSKTSKHLRHQWTKLCLTSDSAEPTLERCSDMNELQMWVLEDYKPQGHISEAEEGAS